MATIVKDAQTVAGLIGFLQWKQRLIDDDYSQQYEKLGRMMMAHGTTEVTVVKSQIAKLRRMNEQHKELQEFIDKLQLELQAMCEWAASGEAVSTNG